ncbi:hypothetical protein PoB_006896100 [Plakobranchus ocellatus]|uniref:Secreted protein n=1 Tax=Plakobranchus ocellatus TaxID=259542 RepID=A0AAV4DEA6_9GAST|nr:hypothetical protein PoB_006896100 [Plakobranchus ocellatus]
MRLFPCRVRMLLSGCGSILAMQERYCQGAAPSLPSKNAIVRVRLHPCRARTLLSGFHESDKSEITVNGYKSQAVIKKREAMCEE